MEFAKGVHCEIKSWENDYDHVRTEKIVLQTVEAAQQLKKFLSEIMCSGSNKNLPKPYVGKCFGNNRNDNYELLEEIMIDYLTHDEFAEDRISTDYLCDLIGTTENGGWRVFDSMTAFVVDMPIRFRTLAL